MRPCNSARSTKAAGAYPGGLMSRVRVCHSSEDKPVASTIAVICGSSGSSWLICTRMVRTSSIEVLASVSICACCSSVSGWEKFRISMIISSEKLDLWPQVSMYCQCQVNPFRSVRISFSALLAVGMIYSFVLCLDLDGW